MSIAELKINAIIESVIMKRFKEGKFPEVHQITSDIYNKLRDLDLYMPVYSFEEVVYEDRAQSGVYNRMLDEIEIDLYILYHTAMALSKALTDHVVRQSIEHEQLKNDLTNLKNELKTKILRSSKSGLLTTLYDDFIDMQKIDTSKTTANVDLSSHEVRISANSNTIDKLSFVASDIYITGEISKIPAAYHVSTQETGKLLNILSDAVNQKWNLKIETNTNASISYTIYLQLLRVNQYQYINAIRLLLNSPKPTNVLIQTRNTIGNGQYEWIDLPGYGNQSIADSSTYDLYFQEESPMFRIILSKNECDEVVNNKYIYRFGINNISFYGKKYSNRSELISKPFDITGLNYGKASIAVDEKLLDGTDIEYYLSVDADDWIRMSPSHYANPVYKQYLDFNNLKHNSVNFRIEPESSTKNLILPSLKTNGMDFYMLGTLPKNQKIVKDTEQLYVGANNWSIQSAVTGLDTIPNKDIFASIFSTIKNVSYSKTDQSLYLNVTDLPNEPHLYKIVTNVKSPSSRNYNVDIAKNDVEYLIILNNKNITNQYNQIESISLNQGMNSIVLYIYKPEGCNNININFGIILEEGSMILANENPMTKVSVFDLQQRISAISQKEYAIHEIDDEYIIILNHIAKDLDYIFEYNYTAKQINNIRFKAVLLNNKPINITPTLKRYAINIIN